MKKPREIFVFGSNLAGTHGAGSALEALNNYGAVMGVGIGPMGNSYAIPTKNEMLKTMSLSRIRPYVNQFLDYAAEHQDRNFRIVAIGCGLAGYGSDDIAPMFRNATSNCILPKEFLTLLNEGEA